MVLRRVIFITAIVSSALVCGVFGTFGALADQGPLSGTVKALKVIKSENGRESFIPANEALPNDVLEYRLTYINNGDAALRHVAITDPIPSGTEYMTRSATQPQDGSVEFSVDGGQSYHAWPVRVKKTLENGQDVWTEATPEMVTHIRWTISDQFEPQTEFTFSYRATVK